MPVQAPARHQVSEGTSDAVASEETSLVSIDGACLRGKCEADPALGYDLLKLLSGVFVERLQDTRLRLLDLYARSSHG